AEQARTDLAFDDELMHYTSRRLSEGASSEEITAEIERFKELASTGMTMDEILGLADHAAEDVSARVAGAQADESADAKGEKEPEEAQQTSPSGVQTEPSSEPASEPVSELGERDQEAPSSRPATESENITEG